MTFAEFLAIANVVVNFAFFIGAFVVAGYLWYHTQPKEVKVDRYIK